MIELLIAILCACAPAQGPYAPAVRLDPPSSTTVNIPVVPPFDGTIADGVCVGAIPLLEWYSPGWDVNRMARIMHRESRCQPGVTSNTNCCRGLLQMHQMHVPMLAECGVFKREDLFDPVKNVCSAAVLFERAGGMSPWAL